MASYGDEPRILVSGDTSASNPAKQIVFDAIGRETATLGQRLGTEQPNDC